MTTFAMDVETPPLYKDLETWDVSPGSLFVQFLSAFCLNDSAPTLHQLRN